MDKINVGWHFDMPDDMSELGRTGGYGIAENEEGLYIVGHQVFNFAEAPIMPSTIMPATKEFLEGLPAREDGEKSISEVFNLDSKTVYWLVTVGMNVPEMGGTWIFTDFEEALNMCGMVANYKGASLDMKFKTGIIDKEPTYQIGEQ